jgi:site-specific DNA-methyltransferase (adenine-specific)
MDLFLGSGSTLIACEQTNRICYGIELAEKYCDVIVQRWVNLTGGKVILNGEEIEWAKTS